MPFFTPDEPQQIALDHLSSVTDALLFIGMSIGKTAICLHHLNELFRSAEATAALIVSPLRVSNLTWPEQVRYWDQFSWMRIAHLRTQAGQRDFLEGRAHLYLINWDAMNLLVSLVQRRGKHGVPFDVVIFDELTKAKNPGSKRVNHYRRQVPRVARQWGLTGTPIPNSWVDLFAQVRLVDGGQRLGNNFLDFKRRYFFAPATPFKPWEPKHDTGDRLESKISDITITLKTSDWLPLPDTVIEDREIKFTPELEAKYKKLEKDLILELKYKYSDIDGRVFDYSKKLNIANAAALVTKLLQFTSGHVYDEEREVHPVHNLKFDALARIVKEEKHPILVATIFQHEQARIRQQFPQAKFFSDAKSIKDQENLINAWNAGKVPLLVAHPASVGHGLNFQYGSHVMLWVTLTYSRELYEQMIARLARRGQKQVIKVYRLMIPGTVDDAVAEALATKAENESRLIAALQMLESYRNGKNL